MLSDEERDSISAAYQDGNLFMIYQAVERIATGAARAAERALVERVEAAAESDHRFTGMNCACGHELNSPRGWLTHVLRTALRPEAATTEGAHKACPRRVENGTVHYACGISVEMGFPGGVYAEHERQFLAARPSSTRGGDDSE